MVCYRIIFILTFALLPLITLAQKPINYSLKPVPDISLASVSVLWTGANFLAESKSSVSQGKTWYFHLIDKGTRTSLNKTTARVSDITAALTGISALYWISTRSGNQKWHQAGIMAENAWITWNITQSTKMLVHRARPYTRNPGFVFSKKDDSYSFFSGHSAMVASLAGSMFVMNRQYCCTGSQKAVLIGTGALALTTGVLRVAAGKHYPSDVLTGFVVGMGVAWINSKIHED
jgi:membrane-associated phospholipid phosphatase